MDEFNKGIVDYLNLQGEPVSFDDLALGLDEKDRQYLMGEVIKLLAAGEISLTT